MANFLAMAGNGAEPAAEDSVAIGSAFLLLGTIVLLLGLFVVVAIMLTRSYRRRQEGPRQRETAPSPDAWQEAGRRMQVPPGEDRE